MTQRDPEDMPVVLFRPGGKPDAAQDKRSDAGLQRRMGCWRGENAPVCRFIMDNRVSSAAVIVCMSEERFSCSASRFKRNRDRVLREPEDFGRRRITARHWALVLNSSRDDHQTGSLCLSPIIKRRNAATSSR
jgi:hypothetical protein